MKFKCRLACLVVLVCGFLTPVLAMEVEKKKTIIIPDSIIEELIFCSNILKYDFSELDNMKEIKIAEIDNVVQIWTRIKNIYEYKKDKINFKSQQDIFNMRQVVLKLKHVNDWIIIIKNLAQLKKCIQGEDYANLKLCYQENKTVETSKPLIEVLKKYRNLLAKYRKDFVSDEKCKKEIRHCILNIDEKINCYKKLQDPRTNLTSVENKLDNLQQSEDGNPLENVTISNDQMLSGGGEGVGALENEEKQPELTLNDLRRAVNLLPFTTRKDAEQDKLSYFDDFVEEEFDGEDENIEIGLETLHSFNFDSDSDSYLDGEEFSSDPFTTSVLIFPTTSTTLLSAKEVNDTKQQYVSSQAMREDMQKKGATYYSYTCSGYCFRYGNGKVVGGVYNDNPSNQLLIVPENELNNFAVDCANEAISSCNQYISLDVKTEQAQPNRQPIPKRKINKQDSPISNLGSGDDTGKEKEKISGDSLSSSTSSSSSEDDQSNAVPSARSVSVITKKASLSSSSSEEDLDLSFLGDDGSSVSQLVGGQGAQLGSGNQPPAGGNNSFWYTMPHLSRNAVLIATGSLACACAGIFYCVKKYYKKSDVLEKEKQSDTAKEQCDKNEENTMVSEQTDTIFVAA